VSVRIDPTQVAGAVARRPFAYVITVSSDDGPHVRAVVAQWLGESFVARVGRRTTNNVEETGTATIVWPPLSVGERRHEYDDHTVIADCSAKCRDNGDSHELTAKPKGAVWHRPAK